MKPKEITVNYKFQVERFNMIDLGVTYTLDDGEDETCAFVEAMANIKSLVPTMEEIHNGSFDEKNIQGWGVALSSCKSIEELKDLWCGEISSPSIALDKNPYLRRIAKITAQKLQEVK